MAVEVLKAWAERWVVPPVQPVAVPPLPAPASAGKPSDPSRMEGETLPSVGHRDGEAEEYCPSSSAASYAMGAQFRSQSVDALPPAENLASTVVTTPAPPSAGSVGGGGNIWADLIEGSLEVSPHLPLHRVVTVFLQSELCVC